ncbi:MAG: hypothetical protein AABZ39_13605 [Spirochaetota bacterium]
MANTGSSKRIALLSLAAAAALCAATNERFVRSSSTETIPPPPSRTTNTIDITAATKIAGESLIIADYYEYREKDIPLWHRSEIVFLISAPFTFLYSYLALAPLDSDKLLFVMPVTYFRNQTGMYVASSLFYAVTTLLWSIAITVDDARTISLKPRTALHDITPGKWFAGLDIDDTRGVTLMFRHVF